MRDKPTQEDVARRARVSRGLVSLALVDAPQVAEETKARIRAAAKELGYVRNLGAAMLAANRSLVIGVLLPDMRNPFFESMVESLQIHADAMGLLPLIATAAQSSSREQLVLQRFRELRVTGVVLVSPAIKPLTLRGYAEYIPLVSIAAQHIGGLVDSVHVDEKIASELVLTHAQEQGFTRIIYLAPPQDHRDSSFSIRSQQFVRMAAKRGLPMSICASVEELIRQQFPAGVLRGRQRLAVVAHNDLIAMDAIAALRRLGLVSGRDVAVVSYDDTYLAQRAEFDITSVNQNVQQLGQEALRLLVARQKKPRQAGQNITIMPSLSIRSSSAGPTSAK